jgi:hypothetical protein
MVMSKLFSKEVPVEFGLKKKIDNTFSEILKAIINYAGATAVWCLESFQPCC